LDPVLRGPSWLTPDFACERERLFLFDAQRAIAIVRLDEWHNPVGRP
jgi:hypothetical protein